MAIKRLIILFALLACAVPSFAQTTSVSATAITDAAGVVWKNGTFNFQFVPSPVNPFGPYQQGGVPFNISQVISGSLDGAGSFTQAVPDNKTITPAGSGWKFTVCPAATSPCSTFTFTITGASQVISVTPPAIAISMTTPPPGASAYTDSEIIGARQGQFYWNLTDNTLHICQLPVCTWVSLVTSTINAAGVNLSNVFTASNFFTNRLSTGNLNDILVVDGVQFASIAAAVTAAGSNPRIIIVPSTYSGTECLIPPSTVYFWDFRNLSGSPCGANTDSYNGLTAGGVQSFLRHSWVLAVPSTSRSYELTTNLASYSGSLPGGGNSLEGITSVATIINTPTFPGSTLNLVGVEAHAFTQSLLGLLPNAYGIVTSAGQQAGTTNITTAAGLFVQTNPNVGGTIANNYGIFMQVQSGGTARNFSFFSQGAGLFSSDAGGSGINFEDSALVTHPVLTALSATNQMRFRPLLDTAGFCFDNLASSADWLCAKSTGVSIPTVGLSIGGGTNLTTSNQTGTGSIVLATSPTITSPTIASGINGDGSGLKAKRGAAGCATAAPAGSTCTTTVTWTTPFADANYTAMCGGRGITSGVPVYGGITAQLAASVTFQTVSGTAAAAQFTNIDCTAVHD